MNEVEFEEFVMELSSVQREENFSIRFKHIKVKRF